MFLSYRINVRRWIVAALISIALVGPILAPATVHGCETSSTLSCTG